jgi:hypothetical protein
MANEITVSGSLEFSKGSLDVDLSKGSLQVTVTGTEYIRNTLIVTQASEVAIPKGSITTVGWFLGINRDATNFITIRPGSAKDDCIKINPGEFALFRFDNTDANTPYAIAAVADCVMEYLLIET